MENRIYNRTELLFGKDKMNMIKNSSVLICGIGGVGSYTLESLTRCGVGTICIVDKDVVDATNKNRQIIALDSTLGKDKVEVAKKRCLDINKDINIIEVKENIDENNIENIINNTNINFDYIVDCVDNLQAKTAIIVYANKNNIRCISSMGFANKINPLEIKVDDIYKTSVCPLAKLMRKELKNKNIKKQKVVYSTEIPIKPEKVENKNVLGSVSFVPSVAGIVIASEVIKDITSN